MIARINKERLLDWKFITDRDKKYRSATWSGRTINMIYDPADNVMFSKIFITVHFYRSGRIIRQTGFIIKVVYNDQIEENVKQMIEEYIDEELTEHGL